MTKNQIKTAIVTNQATVLPLMRRVKEIKEQMLSSQKTGDHRDLCYLIEVTGVSNAILVIDARIKELQAMLEVTVE